MKCYYEILDVPMDADDTQIKTAYRKLALRWHPDKNLDNSEYAKGEFQLVQQAYEILSDRQERAWYDKHREQILCGSNSEYKDSDLNIFQYFTSSCFKGFDDSENGFYTVYKMAFEKIIEDDIRCMLNKDELMEVPSFGTSTSDYEEIVGPFYDYWTSYSTKKSFIWLDHYNIQEVRDRRVLKLIEKEHKKNRQKAKKEWNEEVRALVAFVRKRDKRVKEYVKIREAKILENRQKNEEISRQKRIERNKLLNESHTEAEWSKFDNVKQELEQIEKSLVEEFGEHASEEEEGEDEVDFEPSNLYCVACNKVFKSPKAFENHELSKKHKENVLKLKETMEEECSQNEDESESCSDEAAQVDTDELNSDEETVLSDSSVEKVLKQKKKHRKTKKLTRESVSEDHVECFPQTENVDDFKFENSKRKSKNRKIKANRVDSDKNIINSQIFSEQNNKDDSEDTKLSNEKPVKTSRKSRNKQTKENSSDSASINTNHCCVTCKADFPSKNKLFNHLKKTGHSVYTPQCTKSVANKRLEK